MTPGKQTALMPGNEDKVGYWLTPPDLMAQLQAEFGPLEDVCPYPRPAGWDALRESWPSRAYVNPPFVHGISLLTWARKAVAEHALEKTVVFIAPVDGLVSTLIPAGAEIRVVGRVAWRNPNGETFPRGKQAKWPSALFILRPKP